MGPQDISPSSRSRGQAARETAASRIQWLKQKQRPSCCAAVRKTGALALPSAITPTPDLGLKFQLGEGGFRRPPGKAPWSHLPHALRRQTTSGGLLPSISTESQVSGPVPAVDTHKSQLCSRRQRGTQGFGANKKPQVPGY